ncbi:retrovirus-related pol polyprotein from transposon TNT 1-94 [Tanacetum coccineum]
MRTRIRRMGIRIPQSDVLTSVTDDAIIKERHDGLVRATTTASSLEAEQGSGNIAKTQTKATSSRPSSPRTSSEGGLGCHITMGDIPVQARPKRVSNLPNELPLGEGNTSRSGEGSMQLLELINLYTKLSDKVTSLEDELASTKAVYNKALITLIKRDSIKQWRMIEEIDKDETVNLVKSRELRKSHDTAEHRMESEHDDDDNRTLAEIVLNIKEVAAKSFYEEAQAKILQDEVYAKQVKAQWIADEERIPQEAKQIDEREIVINWNDPDVLSYEDIRPIFERVWDQNQAFVPKDSEIKKEVIKRPGFDLQQERSKKTRGSRKKTLAKKRAREKQSKEGAKRQKTNMRRRRKNLKPIWIWGVPLKLWTECILTATYLINTLPSSVLNEKSPYEMIYKKPHTLSHLRVFGCLCFATIVNNNDKLGSRSEKCVMMGYCNFKKGYRLYSLDRHQFIFSRDVKFFESIFPFKDYVTEKAGTDIAKITRKWPKRDKHEHGNE